MSVMRTLRQNRAVENATPLPFAERQLLVAVLQRAIADYQSSNPRLKKEAGEWLFGDLENPTMEPFTFPWMCELFGGIQRAMEQVDRKTHLPLVPI